MSRMAIGVFRSSEAEGLLDDLLTSGVLARDISVLAPESEAISPKGAAPGGATFANLPAHIQGLRHFEMRGFGGAMAKGPIVEAAERSGSIEGDAVIRVLLGEGVPERHARAYVDGMKEGGAIVAARVDDAMLPRTLELMQRHAGPAAAGKIAMKEERLKEERLKEERLKEERLTESRIEQESERRASAQSSTELRGGAATEFEKGRSILESHNGSPVQRGEMKDEARVQIVEEEIAVGKRKVDRGGVRLTRQVTSKLVEQDINLREEHISVERLPSDKTIDPMEPGVFEEKTIELHETGEEPVVAKRARIVGEVVLHRDTDERTEHIRETVRRSDVLVEPVAGERKSELSGYESERATFREHYESTYGSGGGSFEHYDPAYRFGYRLRGEGKQGHEWSSLEPRARSAWEQEHPNTWDRFKAAIRHAWERTSGKQ